MTKTEAKRIENEKKDKFIRQVAKCVFDFACKLQKDNTFAYKLSYEKKGRNQHFHFLKYEQKAHFYVYSDGNIAMKEEGFQLDNEFQLFVYEGKTEIEKEVFISDFKVFLRRFAKAYMDPASFGDDEWMYYGHEATLTWERLIEEKKENAV